MFFKKSSKAVEEGVTAKVSNNEDKLPPIPGAENRPTETATGDGNEHDELPRIASDDENDASSKNVAGQSVAKNEDANKPSAYIKPANFDYWVRAMDVNGLVYYYNTKTAETTWLAPCIVCYKNGERFCLKCAAPFCDKHFQKKHKYLDNPDEHLWSTQEQQTDREELTNPDEQEYCIECQLKIATRLCVECWDPYCGRCFELVHHVGNLKTHSVMTYSRAHEGWYTVRRYDAGGGNNSDSMKMLMQSATAVANAGDNGSFIASGTSQRGISMKENQVKSASNKPGIIEYYVHGVTKEVTYEKPFELMSDLEKVLMQNWKLHQEAAETYVKQLEEVQFELEKVKYERDNLLVQNAQIAQGLVPVAGGKNKKNNKATANAGVSSSNRPQSPVLEKMIELETDEYRQKLLHPSDRKRGEARANYMKSLLDQPVPK